MAAVRLSTPVTMPALCVVARGHKGGSAVCERVCPTNAIHIEPPESTTPGPMIDGETCESCHLCVRACPSGAIQDRALAATLEAAIRRRLRNTRQIVLRCAGRHTAEERPPEAVQIMEEAESIILPCLGVVSQAVLVLASACGVESVVLDNRLCPGCHWRKGTALALQAAKHAQSLLRLFGRDLEVRLLPVERTVNRSATRRPPGISRRQFFTCVRGHDPGEETDSPRHTPGRTLARAPLERLALNRAMHLLGVPTAPAVSPGEGSLWAVAATDACDCCGACTALCPTQALQLRETTREAKLVSYPLLCTGCALCLEHCPRRALVWLSPASTGRFIEGENHEADSVRLAAITLARSQRDVCESCTRPIERWQRGRLCADCHVKQAIAASFAKAEGAI